MTDIAARISELMISKIGSAPAETTARTIAHHAKEADEADVVALEICLNIGRDMKLVIDPGRLAQAARHIMEEAQKSRSEVTDKIAEIHAALLVFEGTPANEVSVREAPLKRVAAIIFGPTRDTPALDPRPIRPDEVCSTCSRAYPSSISFLRHPAKALPARVANQVIETKALVEKRLALLGLSGDVTVSVVIHRGCCKVHGSELRRDGVGVVELSAVLMRVDFGDGIVLEGEHEVRS